MLLTYADPWDFLGAYLEGDRHVYDYCECERCQNMKSILVRMTPMRQWLCEDCWAKMCRDVLDGGRALYGERLRLLMANSAEMPRAAKK